MGWRKGRSAGSDTWADLGSGLSSTAPVGTAILELREWSKGWTGRVANGAWFRAQAQVRAVGSLPQPKDLIGMEGQTIRGRPWAGKDGILGSSSWTATLPSWCYFVLQPLPRAAGGDVQEENGSLKGSERAGEDPYILSDQRGVMLGAWALGASATGLCCLELHYRLPSTVFYCSCCIFNPARQPLAQFFCTAPGLAGASVVFGAVDARRPAFYLLPRYPVPNPRPLPDAPSSLSF